jgi:hypothetical protein
MIWDGAHPASHLVNKVCRRGVKLAKEAMKICEERIEISWNLPEWDVAIKPASGSYLLGTALVLFYMP